MSYGYALMGDWFFDSPIDSVWNLITRVEEWPGWWPSVARVRLLQQGDPDGFGAVHRIAWRTPLAVPLRLDMRVRGLERHRAFRRITVGDYVFEDNWYFFPQMRGTEARHFCHITFTHPWMQLIPRCEKAVLRAYNKRMAAGLAGARARLGEG